MRQYKIIHEQGTQLHELFKRVEVKVNELLADGWDDSYEVKVQQCGSLYIVYKEMYLYERNEEYKWWHNNEVTVSTLPLLVGTVQ